MQLLLPHFNRHANPTRTSRWRARRVRSSPEVVCRRVKRTGLEQILLLVSTGLVGLLVAAGVALARESAPERLEAGSSGQGEKICFYGARAEAKRTDMDSSLHGKPGRQKGYFGWKSQGTP